mmetsp:Transcript_40590/g.114961  ORF Transcript_40590/g.114961 Transcript_40590/m.114961 type:complete len:313 (+) Transcript_40590:527-1465(+)
MLVGTKLLGPNEGVQAPHEGGSDATVWGKVSTHNQRSFAAGCPNAVAVASGARSWPPGWGLIEQTLSLFYVAEARLLQVLVDAVVAVPAAPEPPTLLCAAGRGLLRRQARGGQWQRGPFCGRWGGGVPAQVHAPLSSASSDGAAPVGLALHVVGAVILCGLGEDLPDVLPRVVALKHGRGRRGLASAGRLFCGCAALVGVVPTNHALRGHRPARLAASWPLAEAVGVGARLLQGCPCAAALQARVQAAAIRALPVAGGGAWPCQLYRRSCGPSWCLGKPWQVKGDVQEGVVGRGGVAAALAGDVAAEDPAED